MEYSNQDIYQGYWLKGQRSGQGTYKYSNGDTYRGQWKCDSKNGHGVLEMATGDKYEGNWIDGKKNGEGTIFFYFKVNIASQMAIYMMEISRMEIVKAKEFTHGLIAAIIKENG